MQVINNGGDAVCIVQARVGSSRFAKKILHELCGEPVLIHVLRRCAAIPGLDRVVCAIPDGFENEPILALCTRYGVSCFAGSEQDVLDRYACAAIFYGAKTIIRVTSDCPLIDPKLCGAVLAAVKTNGYDYACNNMPPGFPHGLDCEAFQSDFLLMAHKQAKKSYEREHVTPWMRNNDSLRKFALAGPGGDVAHWRWTLDYPEDLTFLHSLLTQTAPLSMPDWRQFERILKDQPSLQYINASRRGR